MKIFYQSNISTEQTLWNKICVLFGGAEYQNVRHPKPETVAKWAYEYADAMIAEREKREE